MISMQKTGNTRGLVYIGRSLSLCKKVQKVEAIRPVNNDPKFQYYYYQYLKKEDNRIDSHI